MEEQDPRQRGKQAVGTAKTADVQGAPDRDLGVRETGGDGAWLLGPDLGASQLAPL